MRIGTLRTRKTVCLNDEEYNMLYSFAFYIIGYLGRDFCSFKDFCSDKTDPDNPFIRINIDIKQTERSHGMLHIGIFVFKTDSVDTDGTVYTNYERCFNVLDENGMCVDWFYNNGIQLFNYGTSFEEDIIREMIKGVDIIKEKIQSE